MASPEKTNLRHYLLSDPQSLNMGRRYDTQINLPGRRRLSSHAPSLCCNSFDSWVQVSVVTIVIVITITSIVFIVIDITNAVTTKYYIKKSRIRPVRWAWLAAAQGA